MCCVLLVVLCGLVVCCLMCCCCVLVRARFEVCMCVVVCDVVFVLVGVLFWLCALCLCWCELVCMVDLSLSIVCGV